MTRADSKWSPETLERPSIVTEVPWVHAYEHVQARARTASGVTENGMWLIWVPADILDGTWLIVREALARGELGWAAKAMTAQARRFGAAAEFITDPTAQQNAERLIVVYCKRDDADATRVRAALRTLGIRWRLPYKWSFGGATRRFE